MSWPNADFCLLFVSKEIFGDTSIAWNVPSELAACYSTCSHLGRATNTSLIGYWSIMERLWTSHLFAVFSATSSCTCRHMNIRQATGKRLKNVQKFAFQGKRSQMWCGGCSPRWLRLNGVPRNYDRGIGICRGPIAIALREKSPTKGLLGDLHRRGSALSSEEEWQEGEIGWKAFSNIYILSVTK